MGQYDGAKRKSKSFIDNANKHAHLITIKINKTADNTAMCYNIGLRIIITNMCVRSHVTDAPFISIIFLNSFFFFVFVCVWLNVFKHVDRQNMIVIHI